MPRSFVSSTCMTFTRRWRIPKSPSSTTRASSRTGATCSTTSSARAAATAPKRSSGPARKELFASVRLNASHCRYECCEFEEDETRPTDISPPPSLSLSSIDGSSDLFTNNNNTCLPCGALLLCFLWRHHAVMRPKFAGVSRAQPKRDVARQPPHHSAHHDHQHRTRRRRLPTVSICHHRRHRHCSAAALPRSMGSSRSAQREDPKTSV
mmetsp:Transcript_9039/g.16415  ORF Transcript_9039/g.16415 Transcript_9039/m.16415 type:complete len:209 (-) Transcript_9039:22-648(-)